MPDVDLLIRNGTIYDGQGGLAFASDVAVNGDTIAAIGALGHLRARTELDAAGLAVAPGFIPTALTVDLPDEFKEWAINLTPAGRMGEPEEVAYAVAFLASDEAAYITGQVLSVDGGMMMM